MSKVVKPKCADCGSHSDVHAATNPGTIPGTSVSNVWLCGSCEYRREHPDAIRLVPPLRKPKVPQAEVLFP
jgi:hypothetical protein